MSPSVDAKVTSPTRSEDRVQDGRVQKPKIKKKDGIIPNYSINGRTFACEGCKNGHRVSRCTHAAQRPVLMTNDPGRPSADQKRRCDCPKTCQCTKKNCKCDRNCICMQTMYILVYVPLGDKESDEEKRKGEWQIGRTIITDLKGKELTEEEIELRRQEKSRPQQGRTSRTGMLGAANGRPPAQASPVGIKTEESATTPAGTPKSVCCGRQNIQSQPPVVEVRKEHTVPVQPKRLRGHCTCGDNCGCAICLDHPNNAASHRMVQQRAAEFSSNGLYLRGGLEHQRPTISEDKSLSCMGTIPQFAWHTKPDPSAADLQTLFGADNMADGGYFINYPVHGYSFSSAAPEGSCCSSSMPPGHQALPGPQGSAQFPPFADPSMELLNPRHLEPNQDFTTVPPFAEHITSRNNFNPSLGLGGEIFSPEPYVGQATIAGIFGLGDTLSDSCASQAMPQLWSATKSDIEPSFNALSVNPNFKTKTASFSILAPPGTVNHFDVTTATPSRPLKPESVGDSGLPGSEARYRHQSLAKDPSFKPGYSSPELVPPGMYTPNDFAKLDLEPIDFFADTSASSRSYNSPDIGVGPGYFT